MSAETYRIESIHDRLISLDKEFPSSKPGAFSSSPARIKAMIDDLPKPDSTPTVLSPQEVIYTDGGL